MELKNKFVFLEKLKASILKFKTLFVKKSESSEKPEVNWKAFRFLGLSSIVLFVGVVLLLPSEMPVEFSTKKEPDQSTSAFGSGNKEAQSSNRRNENSVWSPPRSQSMGSGHSEVNYNTSMVLGAKSGNAKTQIRAGQRLPLRIMDKFIVSDNPVPVLAELILDSQTDSGLYLPAGTRFYGEASFARGQERAQVRFSQISLPSGEIKAITGIALDKSGQPGLEGKVFSDGVKNTTGQIITSFIAGMAAGSMQTDPFGASKGGVENGLLSAVAVTAKDRAQAYGEKLKTEREWIEVAQGAECDAILNQSLNLQNGGAE